MKYAFVRDHAAQHPIHRLCRADTTRGETAESRRQKANHMLLGQTETVYRKPPNIWADPDSPSGLNCAGSIATLALEKSLGGRTKPVGLLLHTDHDVQYRTVRYQRLSCPKRLHPSMNRKGDCHEKQRWSLFHTLKTEQVRHQKCRTFSETRKAC